MTKLKIEGMSCGHCQAAVEKALKQVSGVETAEVDLTKGTATVSGNPETNSLILAIKGAGYTASLAQ